MVIGSFEKLKQMSRYIMVTHDHTKALYLVDISQRKGGPYTYDVLNPDKNIFMVAVRTKE